jgi:Leucine-rich repeat (LRR) protein
MDLIEELKFIHSNPYIYISNYFNDLIKYVDLAFYFKRNNIKEKNKYKSLINNIKSIELNTINQLKKCEKKLNPYKNKIELLEVEIKNSKPNIQQDIKEFINNDFLIFKIKNLKYDLEKLLFSNKTVFLYNEFYSNEINLCIIDNIYLGIIKIIDNLAQDVKFSRITLCKMVLIKYHEEIKYNLFKSSIDFHHVDLRCYYIENNIFHGFNNLTSISLGPLLIKKLPDLVFNGLTNLNNLEIVNGELELLNQSLFNDLINLEYLSFFNNKIKNLDENIFCGLKKIKQINFSRNNLENLSNVFIGLKKLKCINFSNNKIKFLDKNLFNDLQKLEKIDICNNQIKYLEKNLFFRLKNLEIISFNSNQIEKIPSNIFKGLTKLQRIDFSSNLIINLNSKIFYGLKNLKIINFSFNKVKKLHKKIFKGLKKLFFIDFNCNQISSLDQFTFKGCKNLRYVKFASNKIKNLPPNIFNGLELQEKNFRNNKIINCIDKVDNYY